MAAFAAMTKQQTLQHEAALSPSSTLRPGCGIVVDWS
jgi:hypothetical protein